MIWEIFEEIIVENLTWKEKEGVNRAKRHKECLTE